MPRLGEINLTMHNYYDKENNANTNSILLAHGKMILFNQMSEYLGSFAKETSKHFLLIENLVYKGQWSTISLNFLLGEKILFYLINLLRSWQVFSLELLMKKCMHSV